MERVKFREGKAAQFREHELRRHRSSFRLGSEGPGRQGLSRPDTHNHQQRPATTGGLYEDKQGRKGCFTKIRVRVVRSLTLALDDSGTGRVDPG